MKHIEHEIEADAAQTPHDGCNVLSTCCHGKHIYIMHYSSMLIYSSNVRHRIMISLLRTDP